MTSPPQSIQELQKIESLKSYPSLKDWQVELASVYAKAVPPRGRPRRTLPTGITRGRSRKGDYAAPHPGGNARLKFLIDECLSPDLVAVAHGRGFVESSHVVWMGKAGMKDWELKPFILGGDWTLVTRNSVDFRGRADNPGATGQFADVPLHAGLDLYQWLGRHECRGSMRVVRSRSR